MNKEIQTPKSILNEGADKTLRLNISAPNPDTALPEDVIFYRIMVGQAWIEQDIGQGVLPSNIENFSDIADYSDHNMYLIDEDLRGSKIGSFYEWEWDTQRICDHFNIVADALDSWLRNGRQGSATDFIDRSK